MGGRCRGHGVVAVAAPGMAAGQPAQGEDRASQRASGRHRFEGVGRAGGDEPAGGDPVLVDDLVPADDPGQPAGDQSGTAGGRRGRGQAISGPPMVGEVGARRRPSLRGLQELLLGQGERGVGVLGVGPDEVPAWGQLTGLSTGDGAGGDGGSGCGRARSRPSGRRRRPSVAAWQRDRRSQTSTGDRRELGVRRAGTGRTRHGPGCARSRREAGATLGATGLEDGPTGAGRHPVPEPVPLRPLAVVRLIRALHAAS